jgi:hypothetical protein
MPLDNNSSVTQLRAGLRDLGYGDEVDAVADGPGAGLVFSENYLECVLRDRDAKTASAKMAKAFQWRRDFGLAGLMSSVKCSSDGLNWTNGDVGDSSPADEQQQLLLQFCQSGTLQWRPGWHDNEGHPVLSVECKDVDWQSPGGVGAVSRYFAVMLESGIRRMQGSQQKPQHANVDGKFIIVLNSTTAPRPPTAGLRELARMLQVAFPERVHLIVAGPSGFLLRAAFSLLGGLLATKLREKVRLVASIDAVRKEFDQSSGPQRQGVGGEEGVLPMNGHFEAVKNVELDPTLTVPQV